MFERDIDDHDEAAPVLDHDMLARALGIGCSGFGVLNSIDLLGLAHESAREPAPQLRDDETTRRCFTT